MGVENTHPGSRAAQVSAGSRATNFTHYKLVPHGKRLDLLWLATQHIASQYQAKPQKQTTIGRNLIPANKREKEPRNASEAM